MISIRFKNLFKRFNYDLTLKEDGITIITGPNGYGKSTILRTIDALSNGIDGIKYLMELEFEEIELSTERVSFLVEKKQDKLIINGQKIKMDNKFFYKKMKNEIFFERYFDNEIKDNTVKIEDEIEPYYIYDGIIRSREHPIYFNDKNMSGLVKEFQKIKEIIGEIYYIKEQRLLAKPKTLYKSARPIPKSTSSLINVIDELPKKFTTLMNQISNDYSIIANGLDSTYPRRLFNTQNGIDEDEYYAKRMEMNEKFEKLKQYNISDIQPLDIDRVDFNAEHSKALKIYFEDFNEKYKVYEDFIYKLDLFTGIINSRLSFKKIKISREKGIIVLDSVDSELELNKLSSGEQQEIVLFYELIFETKEKVLLLLDEPEISLHIIWQKSFMDDLLKVVEYKNINVIVATHSPQIISNHWDKQIDLGELYGD